MLKQQGGASKGKMKPGGSDESYLTHQNNPLRAAYEAGHALNEAYKMPAANSTGVNHSYMHPLTNPAKENSPKPYAKTPAGKIQTGKSKV